MSKLIASSTVVLVFLIGLATPLLAQPHQPPKDCPPQCVEKWQIWDAAKTDMAAVIANTHSSTQERQNAARAVKVAKGDYDQCKNTAVGGEHMDPCVKIELALGKLQREKEALQTKIDQKQKELDDCKRNHPK